jgi:hypothetical protein
MEVTAMRAESPDTESTDSVAPESGGAPVEIPGTSPDYASACEPSHDPAADDEAAARRIQDLPKELGVMLVSVGVLGLVLPGVMGAPALVAGGLVLWPGTFRRVDEWLRRRNPGLYHRGMKQLGRFLDDLERRYPVSTEK